MDNQMIQTLEDEIKVKQEELQRLKYGDVYEAQDAYESAKVVYEEASKSLSDAFKKLSEARSSHGLAQTTPSSYLWRRTYRF